MARLSIEILLAMPRDRGTIRQLTFGGMSVERARRVTKLIAMTLAKLSRHCLYSQSRN